MNNYLDQLLRLCDSELECHLLPPIFHMIGTAGCKALYKLLEQCHRDSHIERILLCTLFEKLSPKFRGDLVVGHPISDVKTCIDFAFPEAKIAIYCDGFGPHTKADAFSRDRYQSRELQLRGWRVLRFSQEDIEVYVNSAVSTILRALNPKPLSYFNRETQDDDERAISDYTKAIELDPNDAYPYHHRGLAYYRKGDYSQAISDHAKGIELDPNNASAYYNRGLAYYKKGDFYPAIADFTKAIARNPDHAKAYYGRGLAYSKKGDRARASADRAKAKQLRNTLR